MSAYWRRETSVLPSLHVPLSWVPEGRRTLGLVILIVPQVWSLSTDRWKGPLQGSRSAIEVEEETGSAGKERN